MIYNIFTLFSVFTSLCLLGNINLKVNSLILIIKLLTITVICHMASQLLRALFVRETSCRCLLWGNPSAALLFPGVAFPSLPLAVFIGNAKLSTSGRLRKKHSALDSAR